MPMGNVYGLRRMGDSDYLEISTDSLWNEKELAKTCLLTYIERYILKVEIEEKKVYSQNSKDILEAS